MRKWLLALAAVVLPVVAHAQCDPTTATQGMLGCSPTAPSAAGTDYLYLWQPPQFPNSQHKITVDSLFNGRGAPNLASPGPIGGTTPNTGAFTTITGDASATTSKATGSTTARTDAARFAERINVRDYGAVCDNVTDDRNAFAAAINRVNAINATGAYTVLYVPPGTCLIKGAGGALPQFSNLKNGGVIGEGQQRSWVVMDASYTGDLFSWDNSWLGGVGVWPATGDTVNINANSAGPLIRGISVVGNRSAASAQYAFHFYGREDLVLMRDVDILYVKGGAISFGTDKSGPNAGIRESVFSNIRVFNSGDISGIPSVEFSASDSNGGGTPVFIDNIRIFASYGPGFVIRNSGSFQVGGYKITRLYVEGMTNIGQGDLVQIGDPAFTGLVSGITINQLTTISPSTGFCSVRVVSPDVGSRPFDISIDGVIGLGNGGGKGLCLDSVRSSSFKFSSISTTDTQVSLGALVGGGVSLDLNGQGPAQVSPPVTGITYSVNAAAQRSIQTPIYTVGDLGLGQMSAAFTPHNGTLVGGNGVGVGAFDGQLVRNTAGQVASGSNSVTLGSHNSATAAQSSVLGGTFNVAAGVGSAIIGGAFAQDHGRTGWIGSANGVNVAGGDSQFGSSPMFGNGTSNTAFRLTTDGNVATNAATRANCFNISDNTAYGFSVRLHARNFTTPGQDYDWWLPNAMMIRDTGVGSVAVTLGTPVVLSRGTITGAAVAATADTTNGCLSLTFAPPTANTTDVWHAVARIDSVEAN